METKAKVRRPVADVVTPKPAAKTATKSAPGKPAPKMPTPSKRVPNLR